MARIFIEQTPVGAEFRLSELRKLPATLWASLMEADGSTVTELRRLTEAREKAEQSTGGAPNEQKQSSFERLGATVGR